ncbi:MAG: hypothetical protein EA400_02455 [Chromatiaceae bacterium]|nr:MAG: hypothetical protein EA400_02455 [Chromatiaceae bacterium]
MPSAELIAELLDLLNELATETADYLDQQDDPQGWYNRGYANGMAAALRERGFADEVDRIIGSDPYDSTRDQATLPWGRAYEHGRELGYQDLCGVW